MKNQLFSKKELIFKSVARSIADHGLNVPMSVIVKESGISTGVFYNYFKSKDNMISELYKKLKYDFLKAILSDFSDELPYLNQFKKIWANSLNYLIQNTDALKLFSQFENSKDLAPSLDAIHQELINIYVVYIQGGIEKKVIKDLPLIVISDLTIGMSMQVARNAMNKIITLNDLLIEELTMASWDSIKYSK